MSDTNVAPGDGGFAVFTPTAPAQADNTPIDAREAARQIADWRYKRANPEPEAPAPKAETKPAEAAPEAPPAIEQDAAPVEDHGETTTETAEPEAELPTIEPPRSWTRDEKAEFAAYPREAQEIIARREQERESGLRRSQNEAAEAKKAIEAERGKVEQARLQYEQALPALLQTLQEQQQGAFADIKTMADVEKLAREDWPRYALWDAQQKKLAAVQQEVTAAQTRQQQSFQQQWQEFSTKEDAKLLDEVPELKDPKVRASWGEKAVRYLTSIGLNEQELSKSWNGQEAWSPRSAAVQRIILDATKYYEAKATAAKPAAKPVPPVQRPGVAKPAISSADTDLQRAKERFEKSGSLKDAQAFRLAQVRARRT